MGILIVLLAALVACSGPKNAFECTDNASCRNGGAAGTCETTGFCSFPDGTCPSGSRYGTAAGSLSSQCVGGGGSGDGGMGSGDGGIGSDAFVPIDPHPLGTWTTTMSIPVGRYTFASALAGNYFYVIGGIIGPTGHADVYYATGNPSAVFADAVISTWTLAASLPAPRWTDGAAYDAGYLYVFGGRLSTAGESSDVLSTTVAADGTLGTWGSATSMPQIIKCEAVANSGPNVYVIGGKHNGMPQTAVLRSQMSGGAVSTWKVETNLDTTIYNHAAVVTNGYLYVIGGCATGNNACTTPLDFVEFAKINTDGSLGAFAHTTALPMARSHHTAAVSANGDIYVLGGKYGMNNGDPATPDVVAAHPNPDGTISAWHPVTALPTPRERGGAAVIGNYLVMFHAETQAVPIQ
jgi:hypothetical protein